MSDTYRDRLATSLRRPGCYTSCPECGAKADVLLASGVVVDPAQVLRDAEWRMFGTTDGDLVNDAASLPVGELRRLLRDVPAEHLEGGAHDG